MKNAELILFFRGEFITSVNLWIHRGEFITSSLEFHIR